MLNSETDSIRSQIVVNKVENEELKIWDFLGMLSNIFFVGSFNVSMKLCVRLKAKFLQGSRQGTQISSPFDLDYPGR